MKVKEESEKVGLKLNVLESKIMAPCPITSRQIDGETMETVAEFIFLGSKITADGDYSHEIKRHLLLGRKVMTNLDSRIHATMVNPIMITAGIAMFVAFALPQIGRASCRERV